MTFCHDFDAPLVPVDKPNLTQNRHFIDAIVDAEVGPVISLDEFQAWLD